jgi:hypothetical protein
MLMYCVSSAIPPLRENIDGVLDYDEFTTCAKALHSCQGAGDSKLFALYEQYTEEDKSGISVQCFKYAVAGERHTLRIYNI